MWLKLPRMRVYCVTLYNANSINLNNGCKCIDESSRFILHLHLISILQCDSMPGQLIVLTLYSLDSAVYTPEDGGNWMLAKLNVQITDLGYAQIVEHLAKVMILKCCTYFIFACL